MIPILAARRLRSFCLLAIAALLAACAGSTGIEPQGRADSRTRAVSQAEDHARPGTKWWMRYGDPQLDRLVAEALAGSPSPQAAEARLRQAAALGNLAGPSPDTDIDSTRSVTADIRNGHDAAPFLRQKNEDTPDAAQLMLAVGITQSYLRLAQLHAQQDLSQEVLAQRLHVLQLTRQRAEAGLDTEAGLKQTERRVDAAQAQIVAVAQAITLVRGQLAALTGNGPEGAAAIGRPKVRAIRAAGIAAPEPSELLAAAEQAHDTALARYKAGTGSDLQVLAAQDRVLAARQAGIELDMRVLPDIALMRTQGGG